MRSSIILLLPALLGAVAALLFIFVAQEIIPPSLANVAMLLIGLLSMASLSAFSRGLDIREQRPMVQLMFSERLASSQLDEAAKHIDVNVIDATPVIDVTPEGVSPEDYLGKDNSLALAILRIDIERELRNIAAAARMDATRNQTTIRQLAQVLVQKDLLDSSLLSAIDDILPAANQAIHGMDVPTETAAALLRLGNQLVPLLRATARKVSSSR